VSYATTTSAGTRLSNSVREEAKTGAIGLEGAAEPKPRNHAYLALEVKSARARAAESHRVHEKIELTPRCDSSRGDLVDLVTVALIDFRDQRARVAKVLRVLQMYK